MKRRIARLIVALILPWAVSACAPITQAAQSVYGRCQGISYEDVAWSPDGKTLAFIADATGSRSQLFLMSFTDGSVKQMTADNYSYKGSIHWMPDGKSLDYFDPPGGGDL